ncbi:zinc finger protein [Turdus rufiventris]|nr:zinc finger protein [Turdus rufiventris]
MTLLFTPLFIIIGSWSLEKQLHSLSLGFALEQNVSRELGDQFYKEAIEHCRSYNSRLCAERSVRLPFLDSQTGVAQNNCYIWMEKRHRGPGLAPGQLYTYPARCWRKKRRLHPPEDSRLKLLEIKPEVDLPLKKDGFTSESTTLEALLRGEGIEKKTDTKEEDTIQEIQRVLENDENADEVNEEEDLEEDIPKRKNRPRGRARGSGGGRRRNDAASQDDHDKPYVCDICGKRYKNRPGLSYHYAHTHLASEEGDEAREQETRSSPVHRNENHKPKGMAIPCQGVQRGELELGEAMGLCRLISTTLGTEQQSFPSITPKFQVCLVQNSTTLPQMCCLQPELCLQRGLLKDLISSAPTLPSFGPANMLISGANNRVNDWPFPLIQFDLHFFLKNCNERPMHLIDGEESPEMAVHIPAWMHTWNEEEP